MKCLIIIALIVVTVAVPTDDANDKIVSYENKNDGLGNYEFSFKTSNQIERSEIGKLVYLGQPNEHIEVRGVYSYIDPNGELIVVEYTADENGYHVFTPVSVGDSLPANVVASLLG